MAENNGDDRITDGQLARFRKIEAACKKMGRSGYREVVEYFLSRLMEKEGLTEEDLIEAEPPDPNVVGEMTVAGRTYEILNFLRGDERDVDGYTMARRAREMKANLGEEEGCYIIEHKDDIPPGIFLRFKYFIFTDWKEPYFPSRVAWFGNHAGELRQGFVSLGSTEGWSYSSVLRRKA